MEMKQKTSKQHHHHRPPYIADDKSSGYDDAYAMQFQSKDLIIPPKEKYSKKLEEKEIAQHKVSATAGGGGGGGHGTGVQHPTTYLETLTHLFKGNVGSGIFAMGDAFKNAGLAMGPWMVVVLGVICVHSQHLLLNASNRLKTQLSLETQPDFATTVELCFGTGPPRLQKYASFMRKLINMFLCVTQFGFCCVYFVFVATNMQQVAERFGLYLDVHIHMAIILGPILLSCSIRNLKFLAPLSMVANACMLTGIAITLYYATREIPPLSERTAVADPSKLPLFFGTALFAFEGIGLVLPLQSEMRKPRQFDMSLGVLNVGMVFVTFLYVLVGFLAYLQYGDDVHGSVTLDLPPSEPLAISVKIMICIGMLLTFPLQFYIPIDIMFSSLTEKCGPFKHPVYTELAFRTVFVLLTFSLAESIPFLELFITLVGALCSSAIALMFPPILELVTHWSTSEITPWIVVKDVTIFTIGLLGCVSGSFESIRLIVKAFRDGRT